MTREFLLVAVALSVSLTFSRAQEKVDFAAKVQPILEASCVRCHGPEKQKGKFRLDQKESLLKKDDPEGVVARGDASKSELYRRITLAEDDDEFMPNEGRPLSKAQTDVIKDWINQGANWPEGLVLSTKADESPHLLAMKLPPAPKVSNAEMTALLELEVARVRIQPIATQAGWLEANLRPLGPRATDGVLDPIGRVSTLMYLNLASTGITDAGLTHLKGLKNLTRLHLEETRISDAGLANLGDLTSLTYLNLHSTAVSDRGLERLYGLRNLQRIYLWGTNTTEAGRAKLKAALPQVAISVGPALMTPAATALEKPAGEKTEVSPSEAAQP